MKFIFLRVPEHWLKSNELNDFVLSHNTIIASFGIQYFMQIYSKKNLKLILYVLDTKPTEIKFEFTVAIY